jgi:hypothetical protein
MSFDMNTYQGRAAYINDCRRQIDADAARYVAETQRHEARCAAVQRIIDEFIEQAINKPWRQLASDIRRSM